MKIHRVAACAARIGVHKNTVKAWSLKGKLPDRRTPAGHRYCTDAAVARYFGVARVSEAGRTVVHGRVSSRAQGDDRRSPPQARETFRPGAGLPVAHEDCPCRFGFDRFAYFAGSHGCEIRAVHQPRLSPQAEWVENLMAVVASFAARRPGLRRYRKRIREAAVDG